MLNIFSTREIVSAIYVLLILVCVLCRKKTRQAAIRVVQCACKIKLIIPFIVFMGYTGIMVYFFTYLPFWNNIYIKDVALWTLFVGIPYCYNAVSDGEKEHYFINLFKDNLKFVVLLEFFVGTFTFSLITELILQPVITLLVIMQTVSATKEEWKITKKFLDGVIALIGIVIIIFTIRAAMGSYTNINPIDTIVSFCVPIIFSILFLPCVYMLALIARYETVYMRMGFKEPKERKVRWKRHLSVFFTCGLSYKKICKFHNEYVKKMYIHMTQEYFEKIVDDFKKSYKQKI